MKTDIQIARECQMLPIQDVAVKLSIPADVIEPYGRYIAKVPYMLIDEERVKKSKLILVTAITPTKAGIGKTTVSVGLTMGLCRKGKNAVVALREPSLGPCFGMKGGAAGGGYSQVVPMEKINLHFTGDFHAVTSAHNMISALLDNYQYQHQNEGFALKEVLWKRVLDVNDRALRRITTGQGAATNGIEQPSGFDITPASEIMAILCLTTGIEDLRKRIDNILLGITTDDKPFYVKDMGVGGAIVALLMDALSPNLVQTTENTPAFVHGGPFANIAHGCNTVLATKLAMSCADYVVTEAGFGADLGAEKFYDIKCRTAGLQPAATVIVATIRGLKMHGGVSELDLQTPDPLGVQNGVKNLSRHVSNLQGFGQTVIATLNRYQTDSEEEIKVVMDECKRLGIECVVNDVFMKGGEGALDLATAVIERVENQPSKPLQLTYEDTDDLHAKIEKVCTKIYGATGVEFSEAAEHRLKLADELGYSHLPVCIAKTQYSFSDDAKAYGCPTDFTIKVRDVVINSGSGMVVAIAGTIIRMPGLNKSPQAERIDVINGLIEGLS
ncbi:MAG: formate--tetrahydrofolate ligase [Paludibacteraceae bacterium]|nr:formate--tetrahydrofolate ligase [Paludibacteraceae bacterium]